MRAYFAARAADCRKPGDAITRWEHDLRTANTGRPYSADPVTRHRHPTELERTEML